MRKFFIPILCAIVFLSASLAVFPQTATQVKADKYYSTLNYAKAIPLYEALVKKSDTDVDPFVLARLADCYRMTNDLTKAASAYHKLVGLPNSESIIRYYYAKALLSQGDVIAANQYFNLYNDDKRGELFSKSIKELSTYFKDTANYKISKAVFNSKFSDFSPVILDDNKVVFVSSRPTAKWILRKHGWTNKRYLQLFVVEKNNDGEYKKPKLFSKKVQTYLNNGPLTFSADRTKMIYTKNNIDNCKVQRGGSGESKLQIYQSMHNMDKDEYLDVLHFEYNDKNYNLAHPSISQNSKYLFFSSDRPGGFGGMDIWVSIRVGDRWTEPINLGPRVNSVGNDIFPYIHGNNKLYFSSDGRGGIGGLDVFETIINEKGLPVGKAANMGANFNSAADDFGVVLQNDGKKGYFSSNRKCNGIVDDIYEVEILNPVNQRIIIKGIAYDKDSKEPLSKAKVLLYDNNWNELDFILTDEKGNFSFLADYENDFTLVGEKEDYSNSQLAVSTKNIPTKQELIADIYMELGDGKIIIPEKVIFDEPIVADDNNQIIEKPVVVEKIKEPVVTNVVEETPSAGTLLNDAVVFNISVVDGSNNNPLPNVNIKLTNKKTGDVEILTTSNIGEASKTLNNMRIGDNLDWVFNLSLSGYFPRERPFGYTIIRSGTVNVNETMFRIEKGQEVGTAININPIYFDYDKFDIRPDAKIELDKIVNIMNEYPEMRIELGSHTDCRGSEKYNNELSEKRAQASKNYLVNRGVKSNRITARGYGERKLVNDCYCAEEDTSSRCSEHDHQLNRRTEFIILKY